MQCRPQTQIDGMRNIWIIKPGDKSLGKGIILKNSLSEILAKINQASKECMQYVVQKYIGECNHISVRKILRINYLYIRYKNNYIK